MPAPTTTPTITFPTEGSTIASINFTCSGSGFLPSWNGGDMDGISIYLNNNLSQTGSIDDSGNPLWVWTDDTPRAGSYSLTVAAFNGFGESTRSAPVNFTMSIAPGITNGDFESGDLTGWSDLGTSPISITSFQPLSGNYSLRTNSDGSHFSTVFKASPSVTKFSFLTNLTWGYNFPPGTYTEIDTGGNWDLEPPVNGISTNNVLPGRTYIIDITTNGPSIYKFDNFIEIIPASGSLYSATLSESIAVQDSSERSLLQSMACVTGLIPTFTARKWGGNAIQKINTAIIAKLNTTLSGNYTIEFWIQDISGNDTGDILKFSSSSGLDSFSVYRSGINYYLKVIAQSGSYIYDTSIFTIPHSTTTHIAIIRSGATTKIYINGSHTSDVASHTNNTMSMDTIKLGGSLTIMESLRVSTKARSETEIRDSYVAGHLGHIEYV